MITGEVTIDQPEEFNSWVEKLPLNGKVTVDFQKITKVDSSCVLLMLRFKRRTQVNNCEVRFVNLPDKLKRLLSLYEINELLGCVAAD